MHQQTNKDNKDSITPYRGYIMSESFRKWLESCPTEYMYLMREVTPDRGTYTFILK